MMTIEQYCEAIDEGKPDYIKKLIQADRCRVEVKKFEDMDEKEKQAYI